MDEEARVEKQGEPELSVLVSRATEGDRAAQGELCIRFQPAIFAFALRRLRNSDAAREFAQDVFVVFLQALSEGKLEDDDRVAGFILGICRNLSRDRAKVAERRSELWEQHSAALAQTEPSIENGLTMSRATLEDCLTRLNDRSRIVLRESFYAGRAHREVAEELGLKEGNVRTIRHRALASLRTCLQTYRNVYEDL